MALHYYVFGVVRTDQWQKIEFKIKSKAGTARGPVGHWIDQMSPHGL